MPGRPVAVEGTVVASSAGASLPPPATAGTWTNPGVSETKVDHLKAGGKKVVRQATCTFSFSGTDSSSNPVTASATATLTPGPTTLEGGGSPLLRNGDTVADSGQAPTPSFNNTLTVVSAAILHSGP